MIYYRATIMPASVPADVPAGSKPTIRGLAIVYMSPSLPIGGAKGTRERVAKGAFSAFLATNPDVRALYNHDPSRVLGRTRAGTLRISEYDRGVWVEVTPPDSAADIVESVRRGDVTQWSFGFDAPVFRRASDEHGPINEITSAVLREVSLATFPYYQATTAAVRGTWGDFDAIDARLRKMEAEVKCDPKLKAAWAEDYRRWRMERNLVAAEKSL